ncbi:hypothetical protein AMAG_14360 [Allomyces macrogynus ATCC 38327]|uniref:Uncharacterized protein n=1 Tax=Allomyces macrogynus (strain ATCC 38327) TaxID=578462 RepID=A0A0L0T4U2_ALLM3|nr:hypothetical protein AMAG_14360 [Allomyces macrogynus ATCC 38327]|eukprot:KNE69828.1 hypothetical protein AMAG_14360 [Allomyces macrogynus ATCC 38327]
MTSQPSPLPARARRTLPVAAPRVFTLAEIKEAIMNDAAIREYVAQVLAEFAQGQCREETFEVADAGEGVPAVEYRTKNAKCKAVATGVSDSSSSQSTAHEHGDTTAPASTAGPADARAPKTRNVFQQRTIARPTVVQWAPSVVLDGASFPSSPSIGAAVRASVPTGLTEPKSVESKAECRDVLKFIGPKAVHMNPGDGAHLPAQIPRELVLFIEDVRSCVEFWPSFTKKFLYCVEYHGGTWFVAAGFFAYLHRTKLTKHGRNHDDYVTVRKEIQGQLLMSMKAGKLRGIRVGDDKLAPGHEAGKGGNNGGPGTWFVRPDVYWARFARGARL